MLVAIPWVVFAIVIVVVGDELFMLAMIGLGVLGLREFFRMTERARPVMLPAYLVVAGMVVAAHYGSAFQILLALAASFPLIFVFAAARESHDRVTTSMAITMMGILWLGIGFSHAMLLRDLPDHGAALLVDVLVATFLGDTAAYGAGRLFGSRKITPRISPNKTLEGLIGGFIGGTMGFWFAGLYQDWLPGIDALLMGMCVAAAGARRRPVRLDDQARPRDQGHRHAVRPPRRPHRPPRRGPVHGRRRATTSRSRSSTDGARPVPHIVACSGATPRGTRFSEELHATQEREWISMRKLKLRRPSPAMIVGDGGSDRRRSAARPTPPRRSPTRGSTRTRA